VQTPRDVAQGRRPETMSRATRGSPAERPCHRFEARRWSQAVQESDAAQTSIASSVDDIRRRVCQHPYHDVT
jgi:hypothetical protein